MNILNLALYEVALLGGLALLAFGLVALVVVKRRSDALDRHHEDRLDYVAGMLRGGESHRLASALRSDWTLVRELHAALAALPLADMSLTCASLGASPAGEALVEACAVAAFEADLVGDDSARYAANELQHLIVPSLIPHAQTHVRALTEMAA